MVGVIITLHYYNAFLVVTAATIAGIWGLILYFRKLAMNKPWRMTLQITTALAALQGLFGITLIALGLKPGGGANLYYLHYVYGAIVALVIPIAYTTYTTGGKNPRRDILVYSLAAIILAAAGVRGLMTGPS